MLICDQALKLKQVVFEKNKSVRRPQREFKSLTYLFCVNCLAPVVEAIDFLMCVLKYNDI